MTSLLRRSELAVPASNDHMFAHAAASEADLVFLDLEDACAPSAKESARATAVNALTGKPTQSILTGLAVLTRSNLSSMSQYVYKSGC